MAIAGTSWSRLCQLVVVTMFFFLVKPKADAEPHAGGASCMNFALDFNVLVRNSGVMLWLGNLLERFLGLPHSARHNQTNGELGVEFDSAPPVVGLQGCLHIRLLFVTCRIPLPCSGT